MEENKSKKLEEIDELLKRTSSEERVKYNLSDVNIDADDFKTESTDISSDDTFIPAQEKKTDNYDDISSKTVIAEPIADTTVIIKPVQQTSNTAVRIVDETTTTVTIEEGPEISVEEIPDNSTVTENKVKKPKGKIKLNALQITIISVVAVITAWFIVFTVDHMLSAQGLTPVFSFKTEEYADGSMNYMGAGYKIQFQFDSKGNLTQKCVPFWKDGPNDTKYADGDHSAKQNDSASFN